MKKTFILFTILLVFALTACQQKKETLDFFNSSDLVASFSDETLYEFNSVSDIYNFVLTTGSAYSFDMLERYPREFFLESQLIMIMFPEESTMMNVVQVEKRNDELHLEIARTQIDQRDFVTTYDDNFHPTVFIEIDCQHDIVLNQLFYTIRDAQETNNTQNYFSIFDGTSDFPTYQLFENASWVINSRSELNRVLRWFPEFSMLDISQYDQLYFAENTLVISNFLGYMEQSFSIDNIRIEYGHLEFNIHSDQLIHPTAFENYSLWLSLPKNEAIISISFIIDA